MKDNKRYCQHEGCKTILSRANPYKYCWIHAAQREREGQHNEVGQKRIQQSLLSDEHRGKLSRSAKKTWLKRKEKHGQVADGLD